jgi:PIN domain nuclease of toxin-antitoxin system
VNLLLDTHIFVWAVTDSPRLPDGIREALVDVGNSLLVSSASAWEMSIKAASGRWPDADVMLDGLDEAVPGLGAAVLPIRIDHAVAAGRLAWAHRDPFDRMLAAQAIVDDVVLVTVDRTFDTSGAALLTTG